MKDLSSRAFSDGTGGSCVECGQSLRSFSVASYNIHRAIGADGRRDPGRIARILRDLNADIIGLQEVDSQPAGTEPYQLDYLSRVTGLKAVAGPTIRKADGDYGNVLLTRHKILSVRLIDLSVPGREPRGAIDVDLDIGGEIVRVIATHLGLRGRERRLQVERLIGALSEKRTRFVVVLSDINEWFPVARSLRRLKTHLGKSRALRTFPSRLPIFALDRIWVWPKEALLNISVSNMPLARIASDHLPLKATVTTVLKTAAQEVRTILSDAGSGVTPVMGTVQALTPIISSTSAPEY